MGEHIPSVVRGNIGMTPSQFFLKLENVFGNSSKIFLKIPRNSFLKHPETFLEIALWQIEIKFSKSEIESRKSEIGNRKSEIERQKSEVD